MCGIAGIINKTPRKFDYSTFCTLGIANDSRGGDSCGVFIDKKYEYGVNTTKYFSSYFQNSNLLNSVKKSKIALLHCRKASVGKIDVTTAQPVIIKNNSKIEYVLLHNGTINNYSELAKKYIPDVNITGMTDSQVMANIFYYKGYDCLNEYNGGAVFVIVDYRKDNPEILLYKGASKKTYYGEVEEERPLFYCIDKVNKELIFSSIGIYLAALRNEAVTYSLRPNILYTFKDTKLVPIKKYPRTECVQYKVFDAYSNINNFYSNYLGKSDVKRYVCTYSYISYNSALNTYSCDNKNLHGQLFITSYGRIENKETGHNMAMWFFNGVLLRNKASFEFLSSLLKESNLKIKEFYNKFKLLVRFLSLDRIFKDNTIWYEVISPTTSIPFTGIFQSIGSVLKTEYLNGVKIRSVYNGRYNYIENLLHTVREDEINFNKLLEECRSLMN